MRTPPSRLHAKVLAHAVVENAHLLEHLEVEAVVVSGHLAEADSEVLVNDAADFKDGVGSNVLAVGFEFDDSHFGG